MAKELTLNPSLNPSHSRDCNQGKSDIGMMSSGDNFLRQRATHLLALQLQQRQALVAGRSVASSNVGQLSHGLIGSSSLLMPPREVTQPEAPPPQLEPRSTASYLAEFLSQQDYRQDHLHCHSSLRQRTGREESRHKLLGSAGMHPQSSLLNVVTDGQREALGIRHWPTYEAIPTNQPPPPPPPQRQQQLQLQPQASSASPTFTTAPSANIDIYSRHINNAFQLMLEHQNHQLHNLSAENGHTALYNPSRQSGAPNGVEGAEARMRDIYATLRDHALSQTYMAAASNLNQSGACRLSAATSGAPNEGAIVSAYSSDSNDNKYALYEGSGDNHDYNHNQQSRRDQQQRCHVAAWPRRERKAAVDFDKDCELSPMRRHHSPNDCAAPPLNLNNKLKLKLKLKLEHNKLNRSTSAPLTLRRLSPRTAQLPSERAGADLAASLMPPPRECRSESDYTCLASFPRESLQTKLDCLRDELDDNDDNDNDIDNDVDDERENDNNDHEDEKDNDSEQLVELAIGQRLLNGCSRLRVEIDEKACRKSMGDEDRDQRQSVSGEGASSGRGVSASADLARDGSLSSEHSLAGKRAANGNSSCNNSRIRTAYSSMQILNLEREFSSNMYLSRIRRIELSQKLKLSEKQVKIWFQNRRVKYKKETSQEGQRQTGARQAASKFDYNRAA